CDAIMIRTFAHSTLETFATHSRVPVINGLSDDLHPCQLLADMQTFLEHRGSIKGKTVAWIGDGNNMCNTYIRPPCSSTSSCAWPARRATNRIRRGWIARAIVSHCCAIPAKRSPAPTWYAPTSSPPWARK